MSDSITTGIDVLRQALQARNRKFNLSAYARDVGIGLSQLNDFVDGKNIPPPDKLQALTKEVFGGHVVLDLERNLLKSANMAEPKSIGAPPPPIHELTTLPKFTGGPPPLRTRDGPPTERKRRPGWA